MIRYRYVKESEFTHQIVFSEPVDVVHFRQFAAGHCRLHGQPVLQVMSEVVAEERPHGEWIVHDGLPLVLRRGGGLRLHGSTDEHSVFPVERLVHQGHSLRTSSAEQNGVDGHAFGRLPVGIDNRTLFGRCTEPVIIKVVRRRLGRHQVDRKHFGSTRT